MTSASSARPWSEKLKGAGKKKKRKRKRVSTWIFSLKPRNKTEKLKHFLNSK
jgi:hypothetical protein